MKTTLQTLFGPMLVTAAVAALPAPAAALQTPANTTRAYVQVVRLKPDMVREWTELQKNQVIPAQKKAGVPSRITLVTQVGNSFEYTMITPFPSWAAMDGDPPLARALGAAAAAELNDKLRKCIMVQNSYMAIRQDELAVPAPDAPVWRVAMRRMLPGKNREYLDYYKAEVLPVHQKAKEAGRIAGSTVSMRGAGAQSGEFAVITFYSKFADLERGDPIMQTLGQEAANAINAKAALYSTPGQVIIRRRLADLSY